MHLHYSSPAALLRRSAAPFALAISLAAAPAVAQDAPQPAVQDQAPVASAQDSEDNAIVVTGSLFRRTDTETPSPVTVLTSETLERAGITTVADAVRSVSADSGGSIGVGFQSGFSAGGVAVSLRGLGVSSTLVLIDGLRSTNFPINDDGHNAYVDLNSIPFSLIERVEVLKDGASSTYGADAIGGVVNLILKKQFVGIAGTIEGGVSEKGDAARQRANLTVGYGDYDTQGWNVYLNGEYQRDGRVTANSRGFPYNNRDLTSIGGNDNNGADNSLTTATPNAVVVRTSQTNLNNPLSGGTALFNTNYTTLNLTDCAGGTYTQTGSANGVGCRHNIEDEYFQLAPLQRKWSINGRISARLADNIEAFITGSYSNSYVSIKNAPRALRNTQPYGGAPSLASSNPGIVLPVYVCPTGINCAVATTPGRRLNPNNPYAAAFANDPANGAARIYYLFGDIPAGSDRTNEVYRVAAGLNGSFGDDWTWQINGVYARDNLEIVQHGFLNIAATLNAINTGAYNFVNPSLNSAAVRNAIAPDKITPSFSEMYSADASITKKLFELPGGPLMVAIGGQVRRESLENNNQNAALDTYGLTTSSAFGEHTVSAGYFEIQAPVLDILEINGSGRYDHYSEGFGRFSPKIGFKFTPIRQVGIRGTYSQGFRAPTFAESGPRSQYAGFVTTQPPGNFCALHGGSAGAGNACVTGGNPYNLSYSVGRGFVGNPDLKPETSRSFTGGIIFEPTPWFSATVDYYNVKKSNLIANGPDAGRAITAYYSQSTLAAATAAVAAIGPGYSVNTIDGIDPAFPNALPRLLIINAPFVNVNFDQTSGIDFSATARIPLAEGVRFTSRIEATHVIQYDRHTASGVQKFAGTLGPYDLSSGNGTPNWRGNWQNTLELDDLSISATAYYVGKIKEVATDQGNLSLDCAASLYKTASDPSGKNFCYVNSFINVDMNLTYAVNDDFTFFANVGNVFGARAPIAPASYASSPNFLTTWHYAGLIGRTFKAGASFSF
ncbi:TonB-dependent receptor domain-containing protein [Sphingomonas sp. M1-B02]|uniref:TonB-dependent receptor domain-containing protein n=1 Tax=Sphingomonas sp. M1-B02 TaxID=3114300 RepID=UPI00223EF41F|nr:TonB-dependent receptor [Sphingomonas sp. S6-11]UZK65326.1 TonB-dependent receptor [Sphingomonas sp. S6-11]